MMSIDKIVLLVIFIIILLASVFLILNIGMPVGENVNLQRELNGCCIVYRANGCPNIDQISKTMKCETKFLIDIVDELNMNDEQLRNFCNCIPQCRDRRDNDVDGLVDSRDPGCHSDGDADNAGSYSSEYNNERRN